MSKIHYRLKRLMDVTLSSFALIILSPVFITIAIMIKLDSKGKVFFCQERLGIRGKTFLMIKFRSMIENAEKTGTGLFNYANDPRVTKVGRVLRNTSLDELPQLLNVLCGEMSLVGPRPAVTYELGDFETLNSRYKKRFDMLPGITGLAQVNGRNETPWDEKVNYDNKYIELFKTQGIFLDIKILIKTVSNVFSQRSICEDKINETISDIEAAKLAEEEIIRKAHETIPKE